MEIAETQTTGAPSTSSGTSALNQLGEDYTTFLTLLTAQISNQDPLEPIDSTTFVTQLAQLTQVEQAAQTNINLESLSAKLDNFALVSGVSVLGKEANIASNQLVLGKDGASATYKLGATATSVRAEIYDPTGSLIHAVDGLPLQASEEHALNWDGRTVGNQDALLGTYSVRMIAVDASGAEISTEMYRDARITAVDLSSGELSYLVDGDEIVAAGKIRSLR